MEQSDRITLCGKNGSEKSSVLRYICSEKFESTGEFRITSGLKISAVAQGVFFLNGAIQSMPCATVLMKAFLAMLRKPDISREQFELDMTDFSNGQKKKVLIAASLCEKMCLMVWDELLNFIGVISRIQYRRTVAQRGSCDIVHRT